MPGVVLAGTRDGLGRCTGAKEAFGAREETCDEEAFGAREEMMWVALPGQETDDGMARWPRKALKRATNSLVCLFMSMLAGVDKTRWVRVAPVPGTQNALSDVCGPMALE